MMNIHLPSVNPDCASMSSNIGELYCASTSASTSRLHLEFQSWLARQVLAENFIKTVSYI